ncbi:MAG: MTH1187 family thiamine-binding protein [bacterium]
MLAELQFVAVGSGEEQKELIAKTVDIIEKSELDYQLTAMGTLVEGDWDEIMLLATKCQEALLKETNHVITDITIDDRKGEKNTLRSKVLEIEYALGRGLKTAGLT